MEYNKDPISFEAQADRLIARGLIADRCTLVKRLEATNYFRFSAYAESFRDGEHYLPDTTLEKVWRLYTFDHRLRTLCLDAIESIEVQVRTQLAYHFAHDIGPFEYLNASSFPNFDSGLRDFTRWEQKIKSVVDRTRDPDGKAREDFVVQYFNDHGDKHDLPPIWMLIELLDFGSTLSFFRGACTNTKKAVSASVGQPDKLVMSWLLGLNTMRNRCAHHSVLWSWRSPRVMRPNKKKYPEWYSASFPSNRIGILLTVCRYWLNQIAPTNTWTSRVFELFDQYPEIDTFKMGLPHHWREHPLWIDGYLSQ
ncbi:MAG TPA: hypothetical protein DCX06_05805 [Opitutae bacterium]|nr:hypothetical protein [Opitutae bacterium]